MKRLKSREAPQEHRPQQVAAPLAWKNSSAISGHLPDGTLSYTAVAAAAAAALFYQQSFYTTNISVS